MPISTFLREMGMPTSTFYIEGVALPTSTFLGEMGMPTSAFYIEGVGMPTSTFFLLLRLSGNILYSTMRIIICLVVAVAVVAAVVMRII